GSGRSDRGRADRELRPAGRERDGRHGQSQLGRLREAAAVAQGCGPHRAAGGLAPGSVQPGLSPRRQHVHGRGPVARDRKDGEGARLDDPAATAVAGRPGHRVAPSPMTLIAKLGLIALGYVAAFVIASAAVAVRIAATSAPDAQAASGMYSAGDAMVFVAVFSICALGPTG